MLLSQVAVSLNHGHRAVAKDVCNLKETRALTGQVRGAGVSEVVEAEVRYPGGCQCGVPVGIEG